MMPTSSNFKFQKLVMADLAPQRNQVRPRFKFAADHTLAESMSELVLRLSDDQDLMAMDTIDFAEACVGALEYDEMVMPAREPLGGWDAERLHFTLEFEYIDTVGAKRTYLIRGYTDSLPRDPVTRGKGDKVNWDHVTFCINSIDESRLVYSYGPKGPMHTLVPSASTQVLHDPFYHGVMHPHYLLQRPTDMFRAISLQSQFGSDIGKEVIDTRMVLAIPSDATRAHNNPAHWLKTLLSNYLQGYSAMCHEAGTMPSNDSVLNAAAHSSAGANLAYNPFVRYMRMKHGVGTQFSLKQLIELMPEAEKQAVHVYSRREDVTPIEENIIPEWQPTALLAAHTLNAILADQGLLSFDVGISNWEADKGSVTDKIELVAVRGPSTMTQAQLSEVSNQLRERIRDDLFVFLSQDQQRDYQLRATVRHDRTLIQIRAPRDGEVHQQVVMTCMDSLLSPQVIGDTKDSYYAFGDQLAVLLEKAIGRKL